MLVDGDHGTIAGTAAYYPREGWLGHGETNTIQVGWGCAIAWTDSAGGPLRRSTEPPPSRTKRDERGAGVAIVLWVSHTV